MSNFVTFENITDKQINLHLDWTNSASKHEQIEPGATVEIAGFDQGGEATVCHRDDGGRYDKCPGGSPIAKAGDEFVLKENGEFG